MSQLQVAVIGAGHLGSIHARLLAERTDIQLVGVVDPSETQRTTLSQQLQIPTVAQLYQLPSRIDAAIIAAPTALHHQVAVSLLESGVHLFIEKPITNSIADAVHLVVLAREHGRTLQVGHVEQFNPAWVAAKDLIRQPTYMEARRTSEFPFRSADVSVVHDLMIHDIELALSAANCDVQKVDACGQVVVTNEIDMASARLWFANGCVCDVTASRVSRLPERTFDIWQHEQSIHVDLGNRSASIVQQQGYFHPGDARSELFRAESLPIVASNAIADEHTDFFDAIRTHRSPQVTGERALQALQIADEIVTQIRRQRLFVRPASWPTTKTAA
ncbi:MAG: Gfo/Idh/MocA family oxidoreductase [Planctomycetales bacterium]|nr:Gfo/Idh/MocA family oxidoreductase [Planctomycetales bacterium]